MSNRKGKDNKGKNKAARAERKKEKAEEGKVAKRAASQAQQQEYDATLSAELELLEAEVLEVERIGIAEKEVPHRDVLLEARQQAASEIAEDRPELVETISSTHAVSIEQVIPKEPNLDNEEITVVVEERDDLKGDMRADLHVVPMEAVREIRTPGTDGVSGLDIGPALRHDRVTVGDMARTLDQAQRRRNSFTTETTKV